MENFHPELAVSVKSVLENPELAVCRGVISVCLESPLPQRIPIFDWENFAFFQGEEEEEGEGLYEVIMRLYEVATANYMIDTNTQ